jgi:hypothetical protein
MTSQKQPQSENNKKYSEGFFFILLLEQRLPKFLFPAMFTGNLSMKYHEIPTLAGS